MLSAPQPLCCCIALGLACARLDLTHSQDGRVKGISLSECVSNFTPSKDFLRDTLHSKALIFTLGSEITFLGHSAKWHIWVSTQQAFISSWLWVGEVQSPVAGLLLHRRLFLPLLLFGSVSSPPHELACRCLTLTYAVFCTWLLSASPPHMTSLCFSSSHSFSLLL